ncbi:hypothetical protein V7S43_002073 [Phytophthora oleae]|uniref:Uncharacterized protein n=1 Tax=Phytophthora oleae TaxID=2107226 RepID=A0ABD3G0U5_9STRA
MAKCEACATNQCDGSYDKRHMCDNLNECACTCQEHPGTTMGKFFGAVGVDAGLLGVGVSLGVATVATGGLAPAILASVATSAGISSTINPISKKISGERMTFENYATNVGVGATIGAVTGGMGSGVVDVTSNLVQDSAIESCTRGLAKFGIRTVVGGVTGDTAAAFQEDANVVSNDNWEGLKGIVVGAATGDMAHVGSNAVNKAISETAVPSDTPRIVDDTLTGEQQPMEKVVADPGWTHSIAKVVVDVAGAGVISAGKQLLFEGEIDGQRVLNAVQLAARGTKNTAIKSNEGQDVMNQIIALEEVAARSDRTVTDPLRTADQREDLRTFNDAQNHAEIEHQDIQAIKHIVLHRGSVGRLNARVTRRMFGRNNALTGDHVGQSDFDLRDAPGQDNPNQGRTSTRLIVDRLVSYVPFHTAVYQTDNHNYRDAPELGQVADGALTDVTRKIREASPAVQNVLSLFSKGGSRCEEEKGKKDGKGAASIG